MRHPMFCAADSRAMGAANSPAVNLPGTKNAHLARTNSAADSSPDKSAVVATEVAPLVVDTVPVRAVVSAQNDIVNSMNTESDLNR